MKKTLSVLVALTVISSVVFARVNDNPGASPAMAVVKNGSTFKLYYKGIEETDVKVAIVNEYNRVVFTETLRKIDGFVRPYNFSDLPEGKYKIELSNKNGKAVESVNHHKIGAERFANVVKVAGGENRYLVTLSNNVSDNITVTIFDSSNNELYKERTEIINDFARVYNLKKVSGKVSFEISNDKGWATLVDNK